MQRRVFAGIGVAVVILLLLFLLLPDKGIDKYQTALERGQYAQACSGLSQLVKHNPDWWQARELLFDAALHLDQLDVAWEQILRLRQSDQPAGDLEQQLENWLSSQESQQEDLVAASTRIGAVLAEEHFWDWGYSFYIQLLLTTDQTDRLPAAVELFDTAYPYWWDSMSWQQPFFAIQDYLITACDSEAAWDIGFQMELKMLSPFPWRASILQQIATDSQLLAALSQKYPGDAMLAATWSRTLPAQEGLDFLRRWERQNSVLPMDYQVYSAAKVQLVGLADTIEANQLDWLSPDDLFQLAVDAMPYPDKCLTILSRIEDDDIYSERLEYIRKAIGGLQPALTIAGDRGFYLSPDGNWLILARGNDWLLCNLKDGAETQLLTDEDNLYWCWNPAASRFAGAVFSKPAAIYVFDLDGKATIFNPGSRLPVGWRDNDTLWLQAVYTSSPHNLGSPELLDINSGEITAFETLPLSSIVLIPGPGGALAWNSDVGGAGMLIGNEVFMTNIFSREIVGWTPDGKATVTTRPSRVELWSQDNNFRTLTTGYFLGWKNKTQFYVAQDLPWQIGYITPSPPIISLHTLYSGIYAPRSIEVTSLHIYDLASGKLKDIRIFGRIIATAADTVVVSAGPRVAIYRLP